MRFVKVTFSLVRSLNSPGKILKSEFMEIILIRDIKASVDVASARVGEGVQVTFPGRFLSLIQDAKFHQLEPVHR